MELERPTPTFHHLTRRFGRVKVNFAACQGRRGGSGTTSHKVFPCSLPLSPFASLSRGERNCFRFPRLPPHPPGPPFARGGRRIGRSRRRSISRNLAQQKHAFRNRLSSTVNTNFSPAQLGGRVTEHPPGGWLGPRTPSLREGPGSASVPSGSPDPVAGTGACRRGPAVVASWRSSVSCKDLRSGGSRHHGQSSQCRRCF